VSASPKPTDRMIDPGDNNATALRRLQAAALASDAAAGDPVAPQYVLMVDRRQHVQTLFIYRYDAQTAPDQWRFIGALPISIGKPGLYDHFFTPLGVFAHSLDNMDYRAEGTRNTLGIRGYGKNGMRIFGFGWMRAARG
jgi:hypothetical protein